MHVNNRVIPLEKKLPTVANDLRGLKFEMDTRSYTISSI